LYIKLAFVIYLYIHIPGQACFAVSRLISWASIGLERFQVRCSTHWTNTQATATHVYILLYSFAFHSRR